MKFTKEHKLYMQKSAYALTKNLRLFYNEEEDQYRVYMKKFDDNIPEGFVEIGEENFEGHLFKAFIYEDTGYYLTNEEKIVRFVFLNLLNGASSSFNVEIGNIEGTLYEGSVTGKVFMNDVINIEANAEFKLSVPGEIKTKEIKLYQRLAVFIATVKDSWEELKQKALEVGAVDTEDEKAFEEFYEIDKYVAAGITQMSVLAAKTILSIEAKRFDLPFKQLTNEVKEKLEQKKKDNSKDSNTEAFGGTNFMFKEL